MQIEAVPFHLGLYSKCPCVIPETGNCGIPRCRTHGLYLQDSSSMTVLHPAGSQKHPGRSPTTASRAGAALLQRDPGLWGPDRGRHGNGGTGGGRVHVRFPGFRFGADKLPPAADDRGRARVLGIGVRDGDLGLDAELRYVLVVPSKRFGGERVSRGGTALVGDIWGRLWR